MTTTSTQEIRETTCQQPQLTMRPWYCVVRLISSRPRVLVFLELPPITSVPNVIPTPHTRSCIAMHATTFMSMVGYPQSAPTLFHQCLRFFSIYSFCQSFLSQSFVPSCIKHFCPLCKEEIVLSHGPPFLHQHQPAVHTSSSRDLYT